MAKDARRAQQDQRIEDARLGANAGYNAFGQNAILQGQEWGNRVNVDNDWLRGNLQGWAGTGGLTDDDYSRLRGIYGDGSGGGGGGYNDGGMSGLTSHLAGLNFGSSAAGGVGIPDFNEQRTGYREFAGKNGGLNEDRLAAIRGDADYLRNRRTNSPLGSFIDNGGFDGGDLSNINRESLLNIERTGGYSDGDISNIRSRSAANAPAYYKSIQDENARMRGITGNIAGSGAINFKLARQGAQAAGQDRLNTEIGLAESIRGGKMDAAKTLAGNYLNYTNQRNANQLAGMAEDRTGRGDAAGIDLNTEGMISQNRLSGLGGLTNIDDLQTRLALQRAGLLDNYGLGVGELELRKAGGLDQFQMSQASARAAASGANASANSANQAQRLALEKYLLDNRLDGQRFGTTGMGSLYDSEVNQTNFHNTQWLNALNSQYGNQNAFMNTHLGNDQVNKPTGFMDYLNGFAGLASGVGSALSGFGGFGGGGNTRQPRYNTAGGG